MDLSDTVLILAEEKWFELPGCGSARSTDFRTAAFSHSWIPIPMRPARTCRCRSKRGDAVLAHTRLAVERNTWRLIGREHGQCNLLHDW